MRQNSIMPFKPKYLKIETFVKNHPHLFKEKYYFKILMCAAMELDGPNRENFMNALWKSINKEDEVKFLKELENALEWAIKKICFGIHWTLEPYEEMRLLDIWLEVYPSISSTVVLPEDVILIALPVVLVIFTPFRAKVKSASQVNVTEPSVVVPDNS